MTVEEKRAYRPGGVKYFLLGVLLWFIVDFGTAGGFRIGYFREYGPALALFYIGYPLVFAFLIFGLRVPDLVLFPATLLAIFLIEVAFTGNPLLMDYPVCLLGIPLSIAVYAPLTYFPLWIVRGEMRKHWPAAVVLSLVEITVMLLTAFGSG